MKTILFIFLVSLFCFPVSSQNRYNPGLYRDFEELRTQQPIEMFNYEMTEVVKHYAPKKGIAYFKLDIPRKEAKKLGRILAFSDGKDLYISTGRPKLVYRSGFVKAEVIGDYFFYEEIVATPIIINNMTYMFPSRGQMIIDRSTGENHPLSVRKLKSIISEDEELLTSFKKESRKNTRLREYLLRFYNSN